MIKAWTQVIDPLDAIALSALCAVLPLLFIFWALIIRKMKGYTASLLTLALAMLIAVSVYGMPLQLAGLSAMHGVLYGLFPICWMVVAAVWLFNITVKSGQFTIIRHFMASITPDRRLQTLLIAFSFGAFLEGIAGFGAPVAITAAMLVGLGFNPLYASGLCLIANTAPVAFGSIGIPITVASQVTSIPEMAISQMVGRTLPLLSVVLPFYLVMIMAGFKSTREVLPAILVSGLSFAFLQWFCSNYMGPSLPDVIAGLGSILCLIVFLRYWKPKNIWRFAGEHVSEDPHAVHYSPRQIIRAWSPFVVLTVMVITWGLQPVRSVLNAIGQVKFDIAGLHHVIRDAKGQSLPHSFVFNYLSASGTAIYITAFLALPLAGMKIREGLKVLAGTVRQLSLPVITVASVLGFAYVVNDAGMALTMAQALAGTGLLFPFFAPVLGWLGVFITGSDTSANALFGKLQFATAATIGVDPVVTVGANVSGGVVGKMISPQSIAVAAAAGGLVGKESRLFRFTVRHSFIMLGLICCIVAVQAYWLKKSVPAYDLLTAANAEPAVAGSSGYWYLLVPGIFLAAFIWLVMGLSESPLKPDDPLRKNVK